MASVPHVKTKNNKSLAQVLKLRIYLCPSINLAQDTREFCQCKNIKVFYSLPQWVVLESNKSRVSIFLYPTVYTYSVNKFIQEKKKKKVPHIMELTQLSSLICELHSMVVVDLNLNLTLSGWTRTLICGARKTAIELNL